MNARAIVDRSPEKSLVRSESGADQPVRIGASVGDWGRWWAGTTDEACWRIEERIVVVVSWSAIPVVSHSSNVYTATRRFVYFSCDRFNGSDVIYIAARLPCGLTLSFKIQVR